MDTKAAILALMSVWGVGTCVTLPVTAQEMEDAEAGAESANPLLNKVWIRADTHAAQPGPMQIFLGDGTLVSDSCWEPTGYRSGSRFRTAPLAGTRMA